MPRRRAERDDRRTRGSPPSFRAGWRDTYERSPYHALPWFQPGPSLQVREAVRTRFWPAGGALLDIGCGAGSNVLFLARSGFEAHGVDLAPGAVRAARERAARLGRHIDVQEADALALPFDDSRFDGVLDNGCFHTLPVERREDYAREVARILKPEGGFVLSWIARESTTDRGPPHRPSLEEVAVALEPRFLFVRTYFRASGDRHGLAAYVAYLRRRSSPQPPPR